MQKKLLVLNVSLSGVNEHLFDALRDCGWTIDTIEVPKPALSKYLNMLRTFHVNKSKWRDRFYETLGKDALSFKLRTQFCAKQIQSRLHDYDALFQIGGMYAPSFAPLPIPYYTYNDYTMKLAAREYPAWAPFRSAHAAKQWYALEGALYRNATKVFTFSERTRASVINDYGAASNQVLAVGSGANLKTIPAKTPRAYDGQTLLFIGIDFARKGGFVLLEAFKKVRATIPKARLIIVGPEASTLPGELAGVEIKGLIKDRAIVRDLYHQASVFVMPSFGDPFPNVLFEAMAYQVPCVGTDVSGIPQQIAHNDSGFIVPVNDANALAERLIQLLQDPDLMRRMGQAGYDRVTQTFTWNKVGQTISSAIETK